ncbi:unnamed product [Ostreococcus tauri]|uniref:Unnamed product n=1 Tax=Ostreococcus tauri TaxID=70448 RepID=A0A090M6U4_OSTTA|nr:unnamed product [Ostreococcus tauri]CEF97839.1 unnamed product [Ostreococcus tauri]|eukprot:XP_022838916.1 unnamed product [Ostreococcus tauri]
MEAETLESSAESARAALALEMDALDTRARERERELSEDATETSGQMRRLRARLERVGEIERDIAARSREHASALERRVRALEEIVRARDAALRESEQGRFELLEKTKRLQAEAETRETLRGDVDALTEKANALDRARADVGALLTKLDEHKRSAAELERQVDLYRETARVAESRQLAAELAVAKSDALVRRYLTTPAGEDRLALERRVGALQSKLRDLDSKEQRVASALRRRD